MRAGDTLPAAVAVVADRGPDALRPVFRSVVTDHRVTGDLAGALERMGAAIADPIGDRVVHTLVLAHRVGGRELGRLLRTLSAFLREDVATRREIESRQSWTVVAARVSAAAPWLVLLLVASRPQGARAFDSPTGVAVLLVGAARHRHRLPIDDPGRSASGGVPGAGGAVGMTAVRGVLVVFVGGTGIWVLVGALPRFRRTALARRLTPYLGALGPRRSDLLEPVPAASGLLAIFDPARAAVADRLHRLLDDGPELPDRLRASGGGLDESGFRAEQVTWGLVGALGGLAVGRCWLSGRGDRSRRSWCSAWSWRSGSPASPPVTAP